MQRLLVYGNSIFLAGLAGQLQHLPDVEVCLHDSLAGLGDLTAFDEVIVDLDDPHAADVVLILRVRPDIRVVAINPATGALTRLTGQVYLAPTMNELIACLIPAEPTVSDKPLTIQ